MTDTIGGRLSGWHASLAGPVLRICRKIHGRIEIWRATRRLSAFDDAMLKDIGISRGDVERMIRHGRRPRPPE